MRTTTRPPLVVLAGNPNTGKSTLFNRLTGGRARVGNYPGVTVELLRGSVQLGDHAADLIDLPGTYSLVARSPEEQLSLDTVLGLTGQAPDAVVVCVDATQLLRNLYLVLQLQELGVRVVVALTMCDEAEGCLPDLAALGEALQCSVVATQPRNNVGLDELRDVLGHALTQPAPSPLWRWTPDADADDAMDAVQAAFPDDWPALRGLALWALQSVGDDALAIPSAVRQAVEGTHLAGEDLDDQVTSGRYGWLDAHIAALIPAPHDRGLTERLDRVFLHPVAGFAIFLVVMFLLFQGLFAWSDPAIGAVEWAVGLFGETVSGLLPAGLIHDFTVDGVIAGVGSVIVFLPQILLLFFLLGLMEDSGYLARVAHLMDRVMRAMGLHGRAFVPMLSGYACAIPAVMATRTLERERDRLLTMMVVPLMTCSARLPVYTLLIGALYPGVPVVQSGLMLGLYLFSTGMALVAALVLSKTILKAPPAPLVMELPPYRLPRLGDVLRMMWRRTKSFLTDAGTVILGCTIVLWVLLSFPNVTPSKDFEGLIQAAPSEEVALQLSQEQASEQLAGSYAGQFGRLIEPTIRPLGFDWKIGVGLIGAFAAREVFVSTMGVVYAVGPDVDEASVSLRDRMAAEKRDDGSPVYTPLTGMSLMIFFALACQCMSTLAAVKRETKSWKWPAFLFVYMTALAWVCSFVVYQGGRLLGLE